MDVLDDFSTESFEKPTVVNLGKKVAAWSFAIGSGIFLLYFITGKNEGLALFGFCYIVIATIINALFLLIILFKSITNQKHRNELLWTAILMLTNIPVVVLYILLVFQFS